MMTFNEGFPSGLTAARRIWVAVNRIYYRSSWPKIGRKFLFQCSRSLWNSTNQSSSVDSHAFSVHLSLTMVTLACPASAVRIRWTILTNVIILSVRRGIPKDVDTSIDERIVWSQASAAVVSDWNDSRDRIAEEREMGKSQLEAARRSGCIIREEGGWTYLLATVRWLASLWHC